MSDRGDRVRDAIERAAADVDSLTCPKCQRTTHLPSDIREGYCGYCRDWTSLPEALRQRLARDDKTPPNRL